MKPFLHFVRALGPVGLAVVAGGALWVGYLALPVAARAELAAGLQYPVPAWVVGILAALLVTVVVAFVNSHLSSQVADDADVEGRAAALARELMSAFGQSDDPVIWESQEAPQAVELDYITHLLEQLVDSAAPRPFEEAVEFWTDCIRDLPSLGWAVLDIVARGMHLAGPEIARLRETDVWPSLQLLRRLGFIVPVESEISPETVYWLPSDEYEALLVAIDLVTAPPAESREKAATILSQAGYKLPAGFERYLSA